MVYVSQENGKNAAGGSLSTAGCGGWLVGATASICYDRAIKPKEARSMTTAETIKEA